LRYPPFPVEFMLISVFGVPLPGFFLPPDNGIFLASLAIIGPDDLLHQGVADHIDFGNVPKVDPLNPAKQIPGLY